MAIDTRSRRASAIRMMRVYMLALPEPDGTIDQADREHTAFGYAGILSGVLLLVPGRNTRAAVTLRPSPRVTLVKTGT